MYRNTYVEINLDNLKSNVENIVNYCKEYKYFIGVVKGNCYSHGINYVVNELIDSGINYLAVSHLEEALEIRCINKKIPILCMEPINLEHINVCIKNNITIMVHDANYVDELLSKKLKRKLKIHIKVDSGMNRLGFKDKNTFTKIYNKLKSNKSIEVEGIFSHFATEGIFDTDWNFQLERFKKITQDINLNEVKIVHLACSASFLNHKKINFTNGIRLGIAMYGYNLNDFAHETPEEKLKRETYIKENNLNDLVFEWPFELKPAFSLYAEVIQVKDVKKGEWVGYGAIYKYPKNIKTAVLEIGYNDGLFRKSMGRNVYINGKIFKQIGIIGMGMCNVEVDNSVQVHDKAELIGNNISAYHVAKCSQTSVYEVLCSINNKIPRIYIKNNVPLNK